MSLKDKFLKYVELQRVAEDVLRREGPSAASKHFDKANDLKREIIFSIDQYEIDIDPAKRSWYYDGEGIRRMKE